MKLKEIGKVRYYFKTTIYFYDKQGQWHNTDGPAYMNKEGFKDWRVNGKFIKDNY